MADARDLQPGIQGIAEPEGIPQKQSPGKGGTVSG